MRKSVLLMAYLLSACGGGGGAAAIAFITQQLADATVGTPYQVVIQIQNATEPITWEISDIVPNLNLSDIGLQFCQNETSLSCTIQGTPTKFTTGAHIQLTIRVTDAQGRTAEKTYTLKILPEGGNLQITTAGLPNATQDDPYSATIEVTGGKPPYSWSVDPNFPPGLNFCTNETGPTCQIQGTPTVAGSYTFTVTVSDSNQDLNGNPQSASQEFTLLVRQYLLTVQITGQGSVHASPGNLTCTPTESPCTWEFAPNTTVQLAADPEPTHRLESWGGDCVPTNGTAEVVMDAPQKTCQLNFVPHDLVLQGQVVDDAGNPVAGARVWATSGGNLLPGSVETDAAGNFAIGFSGLNNPPVVVVAGLQLDGSPCNPGQYCPVSNSELVWVTQGQVQVDIVLPATAGAQLQGAGAGPWTGDGIWVNGLPGNTAQVLARVYPPEGAFFPGDYAVGTDAPMFSYGFLWITATDDQGNPIQNLAPPAMVRMRLEQSVWSSLIDVDTATPGIQVPIYGYDEQAGQWSQQGQGVLTDASGAEIPESELDSIRGGLFQGEVWIEFQIDHLSYWNVDWSPCDPSQDSDKWDFGDAPTLPEIRHENICIVWLGWGVDEEDAQKAHDLHDDGVEVDPSTQEIKVKINNFSDQDEQVWLYIWIDQNGNGVMDAGDVTAEQQVQVPVRTGILHATGLTWDQQSWLRVTVSPDQIVPWDGSGIHQAGETEDYRRATTTLRLIVEGSGQVRVQASDGTDTTCPNTPDPCTVDIVTGSTVRLTAQPDAGANFLHWGLNGDPLCSGTDPVCTFVLTTSAQTYALFSVVGSLQLTVNGPGQVAVTIGETAQPACDSASSPCDYDLSNPNQSRVTVQLEAQPDAGQAFHGWQGDACANTPQPVCEFATEGGNYSITATFGPPPLQITTQGLPTAFVGQPYSATVEATGGQPPYSWALLGGTTCEWISINAQTGELSGTPTAEGACDVEVQVTDQAGATDSRTFTISVVQPGQGFTITVTATDSCGSAIPDAWFWLIENGGTPVSQEKLSDASGTVEFTGLQVPYTLVYAGPNATYPRLIRITDDTLPNQWYLVVQDANCQTGTANIQGNVPNADPLNEPTAVVSSRGPRSLVMIGNPPSYLIQNHIIESGKEQIFLKVLTYPQTQTCDLVQEILVRCACDRWGLGDQPLDLGQGETTQNLMLSDGTVCQAAGTVQINWPASLQQLHQFFWGAAVGHPDFGYFGELADSGGQQSDQNGLPAPTNINPVLPTSGFPQDWDAQLAIFGSFTVDPGPDPNDTGDDLVRAVVFQGRFPPNNLPTSVNMLSGLTASSPINNDTVPVTATFQWAYENPADLQPKRNWVVLNIERFNSNTQEWETAWWLALQLPDNPGSFTQFQLPDLAQATQKPASVEGLQPGWNHRWTLMLFDLDVKPLLGQPAWEQRREAWPFVRWNQYGVIFFQVQ